MTVLDNTDLVKTGYTFAGWNTQADGLGTSYAPYATFTITADTTLYARWLSSAKDILTFGLPGNPGMMVNASLRVQHLPEGAGRDDCDGLSPTYTMTGALGVPASGETRDFTTPQTYTITAEDGSTRAYTVTVIVDGPPVLIGHWASGAESLADSSGYTPAGTHDGTAVGDNAAALAWSSDVPVGFTGKSLDLTAGNVGVMIANTATNDAGYRTTFDQGVNTRITVTSWVKGPGTPANDVVSKSGRTPCGWGIRNNYFVVRNNGIGGESVASAFVSPTVFNNGAWHHVAVVFNGWET